MTILALSLTLALASAPMSRASVLSVSRTPSPADGDPVAMAPAEEPAVDTSELGDLGMLIAPKVIDATAPLIAEAGLDPSDASIRITFLDAANFEYAVRVTLDPSKDLDTAPILKTCRGCMTDQLVEASVAAVNKAIERKNAREAKMPEADPEPAVPNSEELESPRSTDEPPRDGPKRRALGSLGWGGVGALTVGVAATATGGAFLGIGETRPERDKSLVRDFRPSGYGLVGVGGALVVTGVVLLVVDRVRARRGTGRSAALAPVLAPDRAGLAVAGRF